MINVEKEKKDWHILLRMFLQVHAVRLFTMKHSPLEGTVGQRHFLKNYFQKAVEYIAFIS